MIFENRVNYLKQQCTEKIILNIGCVDHDLMDSKIDKHIWLHHEISLVAKKLVGIDILKDEIEKLNSIGYESYYENVEECSHYKTDLMFDYIIAGEIIEHLFNPGLFLENIKKYCTINTKIIITTPNPFAIDRIFSTVKNTEICRDDHTCWYSVKTLENFFAMKDYEIIEQHFYANNISHKGIRPFLRKIMLKISPRFSEGLIFVVRPKKNA